MKRVVIAVAVLALLPSAVRADGVAIEHTPVGCVVAGKHPQLMACFSPQSQLARARVYFRAEGSPHWYFVQMASSAPCFVGTLPKPKASIKKLNYYVHATDRTFAETRTADAAPDVVAHASECQKRPGGVRGQGGRHRECRRRRAGGADRVRGKRDRRGHGRGRDRRRSGGDRRRARRRWWRWRRSVSDHCSRGDHSFDRSRHRATRATSATRAPAYPWTGGLARAGRAPDPGFDADAAGNDAADA